MPRYRLNPSEHQRLRAFTAEIGAALCPDARQSEFIAPHGSNTKVESKRRVHLADGKPLAAFQLEQQSPEDFAHIFVALSPPRPSSPLSTTSRHRASIAVTGDTEMTIDLEDVRRVAECFRGNNNGFGTYLKADNAEPCRSKVEIKARTVFEPVTINHYAPHLRRQTTTRNQPDQRRW